VLSRLIVQGIALYAINNYGWELSFHFARDVGKRITIKVHDGKGFCEEKIVR
jgi:hypothetical protein